MPLPLKSIDAATIEAWAAREGKLRPSSARLAWRQFTVFLNWCGEHKQFSAAMPDRIPIKSRKVRELLGKAATRDDVLLREQLPAWFDAMSKLSNPTIAAALQVMLLTGARPGEVLKLRWEDVNTQWQGITMRDKVEGEREIPLTPYVAHLLSTLPRRNAWVFASARVLQMDPHNIERRARKAAKRGTRPSEGHVLTTSGSGHISKPNTAHSRACRAAGIGDITLHGLRRSFSTLTEWLEIPAGVVAQIQGHKPSATAEKHYKRRPLDLLRVHHERIESWILEQANVEFTGKRVYTNLKSAQSGL
jgi:integrase